MGVGRWLIGISCLILPTLSATLHMPKQRSRTLPIRLMSAA